MNKISKTQFEFYKQKHYELWDWLSKNLDSTKFEWFISVNMKKFKWADEKYQKHEVDWSKVPVDTKVWVRNIGDYEWFPRYFAKYENEIVYTWRNGVTSFSIGNSNDLFTCWKYARLAEEE